MLKETNPAICATIGLAMLACTIGFAEDIKIISFQSQKGLYNFNEKAVFDVVLNNQSAAEKRINAEVLIKKGMDQTFNAWKQIVTLKSNETNKISVSWDHGNREYGFAAFLILKSEDGKTIAASPPAVFEVCHDWRKVIRGCSFNMTHPQFDPDSPVSSSANMDAELQRLRAGHINVVEFFDVWHPRIDDLNPKEDVWRYWKAYYAGICSLSGTGQRAEKVNISKAKIKEWIRRLHEAGIKVTTYFHVPDYLTPDESWKLYASDGNRIDYYSYGPAYRKWRDENGYGMPNMLKFSADFSKKMAESVREYDWDGCFLDDFNTVAKRTAIALDKEGKKVTNLTAAQIYDEALGKLSSTVRKVKDNFLFIPNGLHIDITGIEQFPSRNMFGKKGEKLPFIEAARHNCVYFSEVRAIQVQANSPWQFGRTFSAVRQASGVPVFAVFVTSVPMPHTDSFEGIPLPWTDNIQTYKPYAAMIHSVGVGYWDYQGRNFKGPVRDAFRSYNQFAARYGQYLYDLNIRWTPRDAVVISAPDHVYWKGNTFERQLADRREIYINLVNFDKMYLIAKLWDKDRTVPEPVKNIRISVKLLSGEKNIKAFYASADGDQEPVPLPVSIKDGCVETVVPYLEYWNLVVISAAKD